MKETTVAHYKILHELGRGGMGVVCKAEDVRLNRIVALKFLPESMSRDQVRKERLLREARAASSLDHPNICTIHEIEEFADGQIVLVMAYYEGQTLADRIRLGRLELLPALDITRRLLAGLQHAHERGVTHRDIKPSNVILTSSGEVKIVDFGLAKLRGGAESLTETGAIVGTLAYLPPEVLLGHPVDHRGDLWSSGVVLYEMLTGVQPFEGPTSYAVLHAITHEEAKSILVHRPEMPQVLDALLRRALAKKCELRFQSASEFLEHIDGLSKPQGSQVVGLPASAFEKSIVVLPFVAVGSEAQGDYFSDGLTDEIITDLSSISQLRVICRTSAMRLKSDHGDLKRIAGDLNVRYVLEGTVKTLGNNLRVTAKLIDPMSDSLLWANKFAGSLEDVFAIQESVSRQIVEALRVKLSPEEQHRLSDRPIQDIRAYEFYLKAKQEILSYSREGLERALGYLKQGEALIGENVLLLSAMGQVYWQFVNSGISADPEYLKQAGRCARRILELDPESGHGHRLLGLIAALQGQTQEAVRLLKKSLEDNPNDPDTLSWLCAICSMSGKGSAVTSMAQRLVAIDPLTSMWQMVPGIVASMSGEFGRALAPFEKALKSDPQNAMLRLAYAQVLALNRRTEEAADRLDALAKDSPESFFAQLGVFYANALRKDREAARLAATEEVKAAAGGDLNYSWIMAQGYALLDEKQEALQWLRKALDLGFINYPLLSRFDPFLESIRSEPEFAPLMESTRERWEAFEV